MIDLSPIPTTTAHAMASVTLIATINQPTTAAAVGFSSRVSNQPPYRDTAAQHCAAVSSLFCVVDEKGCAISCSARNVNCHNNTNNATMFDVSVRVETTGMSGGAVSTLPLTTTPMP